MAKPTWQSALNLTRPSGSDLAPGLPVVSRTDLDRRDATTRDTTTAKTITSNNNSKRTRQHRPRRTEPRNQSFPSSQLTVTQTQTALAAHTGCTHSLVGQAERCRPRPTDCRRCARSRCHRQQWTFRPSPVKYLFVILLFVFHSFIHSFINQSIMSLLTYDKTHMLTK